MSEVAPPFLALYRLKSLFDYKNILRMLDMGEDVFEEPVRDFYTNLIWDVGQQALKGFLRGRDFWIRAEDIYEFVSGFHPDIPGLCRPYSNYRQFMQEWRDRYTEGSQEEEDVAEQRPPTDAMIAKGLEDNEQIDPTHICQTDMLAPIRIRILEKVVRSILISKDGDKAALTDLVKIIIVCLIFKRPLDLSRLILMMMRECAQQGRRVLGYRKLITALLQKEQFDFSPYHPMALEPAIDEEKVTAMIKGERTRRTCAQVQEERAQREEEEDGSEEGSESEEEGSDSGAGRGVTDFQRTVLELLRGMDGQLKGDEG